MIDPEVIEITLRSLIISLNATLIALTWSMIIAYLIAGSQSKLAHGAISISNALVGLPTVLVGLVFYMLFSRTGPLGIINLLYTPQGIMLGEAVLITPLLISLLYEVFHEHRLRFWELAISLGASSKQAALLVIRESLPQLITSSLIGFARAIGELGVALLIGGNIRGYTRVLTTSIALEVTKGEFEKALSLGLILLTIVLSIVIIVRALRAYLQ
ncbi:MAG: ABC transporter permease [archaeon GB-1867-005]|nr:ABC transporter permease [Candidatus Culexmicrobium cathedralense]